MAFQTERGIVRALSVMVAAAWVGLAPTALVGSTQPIRARHAMVVSQDDLASRVGDQVLRDGGNAVDAAVATAFALAVTYPTAGNIGGGGFLVYRPAAGDPVAYDFRETAPAGASPTMFMRGREYDARVHHSSHFAVGVPGTVAGLHLAWTEHGSLPWPRLVEPAETLARSGFVVRDPLARSLAAVLPRMRDYPASVAQFSKNSQPYQVGDTFRQPDLALTLSRIRLHGPAGFYEGQTADRIAAEMAANGGIMTHADLAAYRAVRRTPITGTYRGYGIISMPPISSGGVAVIEMLNVLEGYDLAASGSGSAATTHLIIEAMRRAYADRAKSLGDPDFNARMPVAQLTSKDYAAELRATINLDPCRSGRWCAQRGVTDLHAGAGVWVENHRAGRRFPAEQRDGRL